MTNHANCTHPATKGARAACRKADAREAQALVTEFGIDLDSAEAIVAQNAADAVIDTRGLSSAELEADAHADAAREVAAIDAEPTTLPAGFSADADPRGGSHTASCRGTHHHDEGKVGRCDACLSPVVKTHRGKLVRYGYSDHGAVRFFCFGDEHVCDPERLESAARAYAVSRAQGEWLKGDRVIVARGRKIAKGTEGTIFWFGVDSYGKDKIGIRVTEGPHVGNVFIARSNCDLA